MTFGQSSEKLALQIEQLELALEELEGEAEVADSRTTDTARAERVPVRALPDHLPRAERRIEPEAGSCTCPACGGALRPLGQDSDEQLDVAPLQWRVIRTVRPKYSCRACDRIVQAPAPVKAIARGKASFATLAHVVVHKFDHHLPLYRQAEMMAAQGIDIDRSTLAGWAGQAAHLLDPIVSRIREEGLKAAKLHTDDTPVPMLVPGKGRTAQARLAELLLRRRRTSNNDYVFPGEKYGCPISENTMIYACYRMGYHGRQTVHGFRGLASTWANESGRYQSDWIETALAHDCVNKVRAAYNSALYLDRRRTMLQDWADHFESNEAPERLSGG